MKRIPLLAVSLLCLSIPLAVPLPVHGEDVDGEQFFLEQIEPIFVASCYKCHGNGKSKGGLNLYTHEAVLTGGDSGPAVDEEDLDASLILEAINYESYEMPPGEQLPQEQIDLITQWVKMGAPVIERADVKPIHDGPPEVNEETKNHWAFRKLERPDVPQVESDWVQNPIDAFILARLQTQGLSPSEPADRAALVRRVYYDLIGLPPTIEQVNAFVHDDSPDAYENLVNTLLDSPQYGEHWARYWLDVVRYAESNSFERDNPKPFVWKYRDYVIRAFNDDKPYDEFVIEQLAGDELPQATPEDIIATGYYRLGLWDDEPADPKLAMYDELDDIVATTAQGFLGLTMNCCRCHDHKLDPLPQKDYYSFLAFFRNIRRYGIRSDDSVYERSVGDISTPEQQAEQATQRQAYEAQLTELRQQLDAVEDHIAEQLVGGEKDDFQSDSVRFDIIRRHVGDLISRDDFRRYADTRREWSELRDHPPRSSALALCVKENGPDSLVTHVLLRGSPEAEGDVVEPAFPQVLSPPEPHIVTPEDGESTGRRLALAQWMVSPENPLTARVMANRLWQWHFGRGIVRSSNNFGLLGEAPTHPELLNWLAAEFMEQGWSMKQMHRLILLSNTYQMASAPREEAFEVDPLNNLFWRFDMRRLRAEEVRDSILAVNHTLLTDHMFGPSVYPKLPDAVLASQSRPGENWNTSPPEEWPRRSIYIHVKRSLQVPLLAAFDAADTDFTCPVRFATTQPTQALGMLNSDFINDQASRLSEDLQASSDNSDQKFVELALQRTMQRSPTEKEVQRGVKLLDELQSKYGQDKQEAMKNFCIVALNLNEFLFLD